MMVDNPKYDVALSFLSRDIPLAHTIYSRLTETLDVFYYPENQAELAGTEGLATMRKAFVEDCRLIVVLYRDGWGGTSWTGHEERAIQEVCHAREWHRLFVILLDDAKEGPSWLSPNYICYNLNEFKMEQAIGAIRARVLDNKGKFKPLTAARRAEQTKDAEDFRQERRRALSPSGKSEISQKLTELFEELAVQCAAVNTAGNEHIGFGRHVRDGREFVMTTENVSTIVYFQFQRSSEELGHLVVRHFKARLRLPTEEHRIPFKAPQQSGELIFSPELSPTREIGWKDPETEQFLSSKELANKCVVMFLDLLDTSRQRR